MHPFLKGKYSENYYKRGKQKKNIVNLSIANAKCLKSLTLTSYNHSQLQKGKSKRKRRNWKYQKYSHGTLDNAAYHGLKLLAMDDNL